MGDKEIGQVELRLQILQQVQDLSLDGHVQRGHRLVADDELGLQGQRPGDAHPMAAAAVQLVGIGVEQPGGEAHHVHQPGDLLIPVSYTHLDFSVGSIPRNIISLALPMTAAQLINVLYSVVDRIYLGRLPGHLALTGLGLTLPIISIVMGFANLCGTGGAPLCSIYRGKGEEEMCIRDRPRPLAKKPCSGAGTSRW